jgi:hypothetical protein
MPHDVHVDGSRCAGAIADALTAVRLGLGSLFCCSPLSSGHPAVTAHIRLLARVLEYWEYWRGQKIVCFFWGVPLSSIVK